MCPNRTLEGKEEGFRVTGRSAEGNWIGRCNCPLEVIFLKISVRKKNREYSGISARKNNTECTRMYLINTYICVHQEGMYEGTRLVGESWAPRCAIMWTDIQLTQLGIK